MIGRHHDETRCMTMSRTLARFRIARLCAFITRVFLGWRPGARALLRERDANVTLIAAIALLPTMFGLGFSIDYARAEMLQSRINAVADAAALTATAVVYIEQGQDPSVAAARQIFTSQVTDYADFTYTPASQLVVTVTNQGGLNLGRTVYVGWAGQSTNMFSGILGMASLSISGSSTAHATQAPYMNFFLVMDKSPSMLLPTTSTGITETQGATADTCAFACHQQFPGAYVKDVNGKTVFINQNFYSTTGAMGAGIYYLIDSSNNLYNSSGALLGALQTNVSTTSNTTLTYKYASSTTKTCDKSGSICNTTTNYTMVTIVGFYADGYWLTHNYTSIYPSGTAIDLRVSDETVAAQQLIPYAQNQASINSVAYQMQLFSYDWTHAAASSPVTQYNTMTNVNSMSSSNVPNLDSSQDWWYGNNCYTSACLPPGDAATSTYNMLTSMNSVMPAPGTGQTATTPQEVMLLITDGVSDEIINASRTNREFNATDLGACTTIKNRGIKIAILYTYYDPKTLTGDAWSQTNVAPYLPNVLTALQSCASTANNGSALVYTVQSNQSIATALQTLFQLTIANSHLVG